MPLLLLVVPIAMSACSSAEQSLTPVQQDQSIRAVGGIIVKPRDRVADDATLMTMVRTHVTSPNQVTFLRAMSGGAYVLSVYPPATSKDIPAMVAQLSASGLFEYVEEDQAMKIQR